MQPGAAPRRSTPRPGRSTPSPRSRSGRSARSSSPRSHAERPRRSARWIRAPDRGKEQLDVTNTRQGIEVELKYRLRDAEAAARLGALRTLGGLRVAGRPRQLQVEDRYLDTADGALSGAGSALEPGTSSERERALTALARDGRPARARSGFEVVTGSSAASAPRIT